MTWIQRGFNVIVPAGLVESSLKANLLGLYGRINPYSIIEIYNYEFIFCNSMGFSTSMTFSHFNSQHAMRCPFPHVSGKLILSGTYMYNSHHKWDTFVIIYTVNS